MAGVKMAHTLAKNNVDFILLEPSDKLGGRMRNVNFEGRVFEEGANWIQGTETKGKGKHAVPKVNPVWRLAQEANLEWVDDTDPSDISFDAEDEGRNVSKKVEKLYYRLEKITDNIIQKLEKHPLQKDISAKECFLKEGWSSDGDRLAQLVEHMLFDGTYADSFQDMSTINNLLEEYTDIDFGNKYLFVTD